MTTTASQITSLAVVYSIVYSDADQRKHQSSASLAFVRGIHRRSVNSPHKGPVTRKMFPFDDVIMPSLRSTVWKRQNMETLSVILSLFCEGNRSVNPTWIPLIKWAVMRGLMISFMSACTSCWTKNCGFAPVIWGALASLWRHCNDKNLYLDACVDISFDYR